MYFQERGHKLVTFSTLIFRQIFTWYFERPRLWTAAFELQHGQKRQNTHLGTVKKQDSVWEPMRCQLSRQGRSAKEEETDSKVMALINFQTSFCA